ncbi:hypothetical protein [Phenylobacterium ferrooxidans]|uniref:Uncharacterized protein n=1 Tax=Phenylobacterium ferrooxidans TaxID=2982689 RepID=A0ABW6CT16_9CAUL
MTRISRQELFEKVWAAPVSKVAAEFGLSDNGLRKICGRHDIPLPSRGYWAQVHAGRVFPRPTLRQVKHSSLEEVAFEGAPLPPLVVAALTEAKERLAAVVPKSPEQKAVEVPPSAIADDAPQFAECELSDSSAEHPKLLPTRKALVRAKPDGRGFVHAEGRGVLPVVVGPQSIERMLDWLGQFLRFAETQGARLDRKEERAIFIVDEEEIAFRIEEKPERTPHTPTSAQLAEKAKWGHIYSASWTPWPKYDHSPSGKLSLVIEVHGASGLRSTFSETATRSLADMSGDFLAACIARAALIKDNRRKAEIARMEAEAAQRRQERVKAFEQREERRERFVELIADKLQERARLCAVLEHAEQPSAEESERLDTMVAWVRRRLAELDALLSPTFLDISARYAKVDFDEARAAARPTEPSWYYPRAIELQLWRIDEEAGNAHSQSPYEWRRDRGLIADVEERRGTAAGED